MGTYLRAVNKQQMVKPRVFARQRIDKNPIAKNAHPYGQSPAGYRGHTKSLPTKEEVFTISGGPYETRKSRHMRDRYDHEARHSPQAMVHTVDIHPATGTMQKPRGIVFIVVDANWVHHPHRDA